jgi:small subunit ribosomal protein S20
MPHTESAKKRLRQNEKRRLANKARATELKSVRKHLLRALHDGKKDEVQTLYRELTKRLDQAASLKVIHRNAAARAKARLAQRINAPAKPATA